MQWDPPYNFGTNRDICFKFGTDIDDGPLLRPDHRDGMIICSGITTFVDLRILSCSLVRMQNLVTLSYRVGACKGSRKFDRLKDGFIIACTKIIIKIRRYFFSLVLHERTRPIATSSCVGSSPARKCVAIKTQYFIIIVLLLLLLLFITHKAAHN